MIESALLCLALNVYYESRGEPSMGQYAVAVVTLNRADYQAERVCSVVTQKGQFSWTLDPKKKLRFKNGVVVIPGSLEKAAWQQSLMVARHTFYGRIHDITDGATYFHTVDVSPAWSTKFKRTRKIGRHIFYRDGKSVNT